MLHKVVLGAGLPQDMGVESQGLTPYQELWELDCSAIDFRTRVSPLPVTVPSGAALSQDGVTLSMLSPVCSGMCLNRHNLQEHRLLWRCPSSHDPSPGLLQPWLPQW